MKISYVLSGMIFAIIFLAGCVQQAYDPINTVPYDTAIVDATVLSVTETDNCPLPEEECTVDKNPGDFGEIRVDKINEYARNQKADYDPLTEGTYKADFQYSARPAKVRCLTIEAAEPGKENVGDENPKSQEPLKPSEYEDAKSIPREDGYLIYEYGTADCPPEKTLPGIKTGDKIRFTVSYNGQTLPGVLSVGEYELVMPENQPERI